MKSEKLISAILQELSLDILKKEDNLEKTLNSNIELEEKIKNVKTSLNELVITELMLTKFSSYISSNGDK